MGRYDEVKAEKDIKEILLEEYEIESKEDLIARIREGEEIKGIILSVKEIETENKEDQKEEDIEEEARINLGYGLKGILTLDGIDWLRILRRRESKDKENVTEKIELRRYKMKKLSEALAKGHLLTLKPQNPDFDPKAKEDLKVTVVQEHTLQGALVCLDAHTGQVKALVGGYDALKNPFNRAYQAHRQPGSSFKPFVFAAAVNKGYTAATTIVDSPLIFIDKKNSKDKRIEKKKKKKKKKKKDGEEEEEEEEQSELSKLEEEFNVWRPQNYYQKYYGPTTLKEALAHSLNVVTIKLLREIGIGYTQKFIRKFGITGKLNYDLTLALGTSEITPLELAGAYTAFANSGVPVLPFAIRSIEDHSGNLVEHNQVQELEGISEDVNYIMIDVLKAVVRGGTGFVAKSLGHEVGAKTGTTQKAIDSWFVGFTPDLVCLVYVGYDDREPMGQHSTGAEVAGPIWMDFMKQALANQPQKSFPVPSNIIYKEVDRLSGLLPSPYCKTLILQPFIKGTEPRKVCDQHEENRLFRTELDYTLLDRRLDTEGEGEGEEDTPPAPAPSPSGP